MQCRNVFRQTAFNRYAVLSIILKGKHQIIGAIVCKWRLTFGIKIPLYFLQSHTLHTVMQLITTVEYFIFYFDFCQLLPFAVHFSYNT